MADRITLSGTPHDRTLTKDFSTIHYIFNFYTPEELAQYTEDMEYCVRQEWIEDIIADGTAYTRSVGYTPGASSVWLDTSNNTFYVYFSGKNLQRFFEYFIIERKNYAPLQRYAEANPDKLSVNIVIQ